MSKREKIIVGLACLAVLYGVYELFLAPRAEGPEIIGQTAENPSKSIQKFVIDIAQKLTKQEPSPVEKTFVAQAGGKWTKDPFLHSVAALKSEVTRKPAAEAVEAAAPADTINVTYSGYLELGDTRLAIINGMEYGEGETIDSDGHFVQKITATQVIIGKVGQNDRHSIPLDETGLSP